MLLLLSSLQLLIHYCAVLNLGDLFLVIKVWIKFAELSYVPCGFVNILDIRLCHKFIWKQFHFFYWFQVHWAKIKIRTVKKKKKSWKTRRFSKTLLFMRIFPPASIHPENSTLVSKIFTKVEFATVLPINPSI